MLKKSNLSFYLIILLISTFINTANGQVESLSHHNYARELVNKETAALQAIPLSQPFNNTTVSKQNINEAINGNKDFLNLDLSFNRQILSKKNDILKLSIPRASAATLNLLLKKVEFISPSINVPTPSGEKKNIYDWGAFYWGTVEGDESSSVSVSIFENEIVGIINTEGNTYTLSKMKNSDNYILYNEKDLAEQPDFVCNAPMDLEQLMAQRDDIEKKVQAGIVNPNNCVEVHLWADGTLYDVFNNDAIALSNYLAAFFNQVTLIYANEHINMRLNHVTIKDTNDNLILGNDTRTGSFIMFLSHNYGGGGGAAGGPLCGGGGGSYIGSQYQDTGVITYAEGIGVLAHEIGHVLGSPHTDVCFWNGNNTQLDDCGSVPGPWSAGACFDPFNPVLDGDIGTLMSYCGRDISLGLGQQPGDLMRHAVYTSDCLTPCGLDCIDSNENNTCDVDECYPNPIICRANIAQRGWAGWAGDEGGNCDVAIRSDETVLFDPVIAEGTWSGPNGFTSNNKIIEVSEPGVYTFTFSDGICTYSKDMTVTLDTCPLTSIVCASNVNNEGWTSNCHVGLAPGETANFKPENNLPGGIWSWTGPNGFSSNQQEITVPAEDGTYTATYTKDGCSVFTEMRVYTCDETIIPFLTIEGVTGWYAADTVDISPGQTVRFGPSIQDFQTSNISSFVAEYTWTGPNNFTAVGRETVVTDPGTYTLSIIQATCIFTKEIVVTMNGCPNPIQSFANIDNQGWEQTSWIAVTSGQSIALAPTPTSGNWSWTGPNGFTSSNREITVSELGTYIATYTEGACTFNQEVSIVECGLNPIVSSFNINNQGWSGGTFDIFLPSGEVYIKPLVNNPENFPDFPPTWWNQPDKWLWTGPNGFSAIGYSLRVPYDQPGVYTAAMTYGPCTWSVDFTISDCGQGACDDRDDCTINDVFIDCDTCAGTFQDQDNDGTCDVMDVCQGMDDAILGMPCDDGDSCTSNDTFECSGCIGTPAGLDNNGNCDPVNCGGFIICYTNIENQGWQQACEIDLFVGQSVTFGPQTNLDFGTGTWNWTGPGGFMASSREITVSTAGTYAVTFSNGTCTFTQNIIVTPDCNIGTPCDNGDDCTINDAYDSDCNCTGTSIGVDSNGVCDPVNCFNYIIPYANIDNQGWQQTSQIDLSLGQSVTFGPADFNLEPGTWSWMGPNGFTANTRETTVAAAGTYTVTFSTATCTFTQDIIVTIPCIDVQLQTWLEGAYDNNTGQMTTNLHSRGLLPGQTPVSPLATPTPAGQPYQIAPWNYTGTEGAGWTDADYIGDETDWVLISFRTGIEKSTEVAQTAALIMKDGVVELIDRCALSSSITGPLYIVLEHRNHIGIMTPQPVNIVGGILMYDFRTSDSYRDQTSFGQKQLPNGEWAMFAGDADQTDFPSFDITGTDKTEWFDSNGVFDYYLSPDFNLDGDVNGQDKSLWFENNGISSRVPK